MKKLLTLAICSCLFAATPYVSAQPQAAAEPTQDFASAKPRAITRTNKNPLVLNMMGKSYVMRQAQESDDDSDIWQNLYLPQGVEADTNDVTDGIFVQKAQDTTCDQQVDRLNTNDAMTVDTRLRDDQVVSSEQTIDGVTAYAVWRFVQVEKDVFSLIVIYPRSEQTDEQWKQTQRNLFQTVRATPKEVISSHFVESVCKFGSDCHM